MIDLTKIRGRKAEIIDQDKYQRSAVLLPIVKYQDRECILFEIRSQNLTIQPGEICFPGGGTEPGDKNEEATAVRETCEELGLSKSDIRIIGPLDILITPFQTIITPFVGTLADVKKIVPNKNEVESIFYVPIEFFLSTPPKTYFTKTTISPPPDFPYNLLPNGKTYNWRTGSYPVYFYIYEDKIIWGITARIVNNFIQILKQD